MDFALLGPLEVRHETRVLPLGTPQRRVVLALLAIRPGMPVSLDELAFEIWGERPPNSAVAKVRGHAAALQRLFAVVEPGIPRVVRTGSGYLLNSDNIHIDLGAFNRDVGRGVQAAEAGDSLAALVSFEQALRWWRGGMLDGLPRGPILEGRCAVAEEDRRAIGDRLAEIYLQRGWPTKASSLLSPQVRAEPLREQSCALLMRARYQLGGAAAALEVYESTRAVLAEQLGVDPGPELQRLYKAVLNREPELDTPADSGSRGSDHAAGSPTATAASQADGTARPDRTATPHIRVPRMLPPDFPDFTGRVAELTLIKDALTSNDRLGAVVATIAGPGGVGKTALCVRAANALQDVFPEGQLYASLRGLPDDATASHEVLGQFLRFLGVAETSIPDAVEQRSVLFRDMLAGRRVLVVLDDVRSDSQVHLVIPGSQTCGVLINGRARLGTLLGAKSIDLDVLTHSEAASLLTRLAGVYRAQSEPEAVAEVAALCGHLPLALRIAGGRLANKPHWSFRKLASKLRDTLTRLDQLSHGHLDVRATISLSYRVLTPRAQRLLRRLSDLDLPEVTVWVSAALLDCSVTGAEQVLEELFDSQIIEVCGSDVNGDTRYRLHDLVRLFAKERAVLDDDRLDLQAARLRAFGAWLHMCDSALAYMPALDDYATKHSSAPRWRVEPAYTESLMAKALEWFDLERTSVLAIIRRAASDGRSDVAWDLACTASPLFRERRHLDDWPRALEPALAVTGQADDPLGRGCVLYRLGSSLVNRLQFEQAWQCFQQAADQFRMVGDDHGVAVAAACGAMVERFRKNWHPALSLYEAALPTLRACGDKCGEALVLRGIGQVHMELGSLAAADDYCRQAVTIYRNLGADKGVAGALLWQGMLRLKQQQHSDAESLFNEVLRICRDIGNVSGQAQAMRGLGLAYQYQGQVEQAESMLRHALKLVAEPHASIVGDYIRRDLANLPTKANGGRSVGTPRSAWCSPSERRNSDV
jgi:DNA-binding SARP family transcriptional activator/tetratricopeptide (TPR) repeat protein